MQSRPVDGSRRAAPIIHHPDVKAHADDHARHTEAARDGRWPTTAAAADARTTLDADDEARQNQAFYEFLVPLVKGFAPR